MIEEIDTSVHIECSNLPLDRSSAGFDDVTAFARKDGLESFRRQVALQLSRITSAGSRHTVTRHTDAEFDCVSSHLFLISRISIYRHHKLDHLSHRTRVIVTAHSPAMALSQHPRLSLLGLPSEVRQNILMHLFSDSWVTCGSMCRDISHEIRQSLETDILLVCRSLYHEGQPLLISSTDLLIGAGIAMSHLTRAVTQTYVSRVEHLTLSMGSAIEGIYGGRIAFECPPNVDLRLMPYLKTLTVFN